jgi:ribosomal protein S17E
MKWLLTLFLTLSFSLSSALEDNEIDPNITNECKEHLHTLTTEGVSLKYITTGANCSISEMENTNIIGALSNTLIPNIVDRSAGWLIGGANENLDSEQSINNVSTESASSPYEKLLMQSSDVALLLAIIFAVIRFSSIVLTIAKGQSTIKDEWMNLGTQVALPLVLLSKIKGISLIIYLFFSVVLAALLFIKISLNIFFIKMLPASSDSSEAILEELKTPTYEEVNKIVDDTLQIQACSIENTKKVQVFAIEGNIYKGLNDYNSSTLKACLSDVRVDAPNWNVSNYIDIEDSYSRTARECFQEANILTNYFCGQTIVTVPKTGTVATPVKELAERFTTKYQTEIRDIANRLLEESCKTRVDLDRKNDSYNYKRLCATQNLLGEFQTDESGSIVTYEKSDKENLNAIIEDYKALKKVIYEDFLSTARKVGRKEVQILITRGELLDMTTAISSMFTKQASIDLKYKNEVLQVFRSIKPAHQELISFHNKQTTNEVSGYTTEKHSNTLQVNEDYRRSLDDLVNGGAFKYEREKVTIRFACQKQEGCKTVDIFPLKKVTENGIKILDVTTDMFLTFITLKATISVVEKINDDIAAQSKTSALKVILNTATKLSILIISVIIGLMLMTQVGTIIQFLFKLMKYFLYVLATPFVLLVMVIVLILQFFTEHDYDLGIITKEFLAAFFQPLIILLVLVVQFVSINIMFSIFRNGEDYIYTQILTLSQQEITNQMTYLSFEALAVMFISMVMYIILIFVSFRIAATVEKKLYEMIGIENKSQEAGRTLFDIIVGFFLYDKSKAFKG